MRGRKKKKGREEKQAHHNSHMRRKIYKANSTIGANPPAKMHQKKNIDTDIQSFLQNIHFDSHLLIKIASAAAHTCALLKQLTLQSARRRFVFFLLSCCFYFIEHKRLIKPNRDTVLHAFMFVFRRLNINNDLDELQNRLHFMCIFCMVFAFSDAILCSFPFSLFLVNL